MTQGRRYPTRGGERKDNIRFAFHESLPGKNNLNEGERATTSYKTSHLRHISTAARTTDQTS